MGVAQLFVDNRTPTDLRQSTIYDKFHTSLGI